MVKIKEIQDVLKLFNIQSQKGDVPVKAGAAVVCDAPERRGGTVEGGSAERWTVLATEGGAVERMST